MVRSSFGNFDPRMEIISMLGQHVLNISSSANEEFTLSDPFENLNSVSDFGSIHASLLQFPPYRTSVRLSTSNLESCRNRFSGISLKRFLERSRYLRVLMLNTSTSMFLILHSIRLRLARLGRSANAPGMSSSVSLKVEIADLLIARIIMI